MAGGKGLKVILDTNVLVSFLIGKRLGNLVELISYRKVSIVYSKQLLQELKLVVARPKLRQHITQVGVEEFTSLLEIIGEEYADGKTHKFLPDPKDSFLLDLISSSKADFLVTGDSQLLQASNFGTARILSARDFEEILQTL